MGTVGGLRDGGTLGGLSRRDTGAGLTTGVREALDLASEGGVRLHISRLRATLDPGWAQLEPALDYVGLARACGGEGEVVSRPAEMGRALERALASTASGKCVVLDVKLPVL